ncbi:MFS transporter [Bradyrhizobium sp. 61]|nr:MFS transporter [Bradyrhizobium sp. 61]
MDLSDGVPTPLRYLSIATITLAVTMSSLDNSMVNVAVPAVARDLNIPPASAIWLVSIYQIALAVTLLPLSNLGEIFGYRRVYLCGLTLFTISSAAVAASNSFLTIMLARCMQGLGAAGILSVNIALIRFVYPKHELGKGIGINSFVAASAFTAGAPVGSLIIKYFGWHGLFAVNVPTGIIAFLVALYSIPKTPVFARSFDLGGAFLYSAAFGLLLFTFNGFGHEQSWWLMAALVFGTVLFWWAYLQREGQKPTPLLPIDLIRLPLFRMAVLTSICSFIAQMSAILVLPFFIEHIGYHDPAVIGLLTTPWPAAVIVTALVAGNLVDRFSAAQLCTGGLLLLAAGLASLAVLEVGASPIRIACSMAVCGVGFGLFQSPNNWALISAAPPARSGAASGSLNSARLVGQSLGAAIVAIMLTEFGPNGAPSICLFFGAGGAIIAACVSALRLGAYATRSREAAEAAAVSSGAHDNRTEAMDSSLLNDVVFKIEAREYREVLRGRYSIHDMMAGRPPVSGEVLAKAKVLVTTGFAGASEDEIRMMPNLSLICCIGTGYENVDIPAARRRGVIVTHGAGANASAVADHAVAILLAIMRNIYMFNMVAKQDLWRGNLGPRPIPTGKRAGVIGLGAIGQRIARRLEAFDMDIGYHSRSEKPEFSWRYYSSVVDLARDVDCLIVAAPGGTDTFHIIDDEVLSALGPNGFLVNVSRGSLVDTDALVRRLKAGGIAGAALDVFEEEPSIPSALRELSNVILTPHVAAFAPEVHTVSTKLLLQNIEGFLRCGAVVSPVPEMRDTPAVTR